MLQRLLNFLKEPTSLHVAINTLGNYINIFFSLLFVLILTRAFSPSEYGVFTVLFGIAYVLANILDFGTTATIYSYLPLLAKESAAKLPSFVKSTFFYQSFFSALVITALCVSFPFLDKVFFKTGAPVHELYLTAISVLFFIWQNFAMNTLLAAKKFLQANIYLNSANLAKTAVIIIFMLLNKVTVGVVIAVFGILGPTIFFLLLFIEKRNFIVQLLHAPIKREEFRFGYTLTYFIASQFYNLGTRMDLFLLSYFNLREEVGYYGLSQKIILTVIATVVSITQVLSPHFSSITSKKQIHRQIKIAFAYMLLPIGLFLILTVVPPQIYALFFTQKFVLSAPITSALSLPHILNAIASIPMLFLLYTRKKPGYILFTNIVFFLIITLGCYFYIPLLGVMAAPRAIFAAYIAATLILTAGSIYEYHQFNEI